MNTIAEHSLNQAQPPSQQQRRAGGRLQKSALALIHTRPGFSPAWLVRPIPHGGVTALARLTASLTTAQCVQRVVLLLGADEDDGAVRAEADRLQITCVVEPRPDRLTQLAGYLQRAQVPPSQVVLRLWADSFLLSPEVVEAAVETLLDGPYDLVSTDLGSGVLPAGLDVDATTAQRILDAARLPASRGDRDQVAGLLWRRLPAGRVRELSPTELGPALERSGRYYASFRLALGSEGEVATLEEVAASLDRCEYPTSLMSLTQLLDQHSEWRHGRVQHLWRRAP